MKGAWCWLVAKARAIRAWLYDYLIKPSPPPYQSPDGNDGGA
jgi:hypothetical protein